MTTPHAATGAASHKLTESAMPRVWVVLILALLLGIQPVTTDLYLPALPTLTEGFAASMPQAQLTLTALLLAFGLCCSGVWALTAWPRSVARWHPPWTC